MTGRLYHLLILVTNTFGNKWNICLSFV